MQGQPGLATSSPPRAATHEAIHLPAYDLLGLPQIAQPRVASDQVYLPLVLKNDPICGQFVWFSVGIDRYPGFQNHNSGELWFFDEFSLGMMPAEGSYGIIVNPQFRNEDFTTGVRWLMGASVITQISSC